jgi:type III secretion protein V
MKFIKGETIFGIVCVVFSLIGGLAVGVMQRDMAMGDAMRTYSILSIGEGLAAQIPALFAAMAAGLLVTRTTDEERGDLPSAVRAQLGDNRRALLVSGGIALTMALVPGFPAHVFIALGLLLVGGGVADNRWVRARVAQLMPQRLPPPAPQALLATAPEARPVLPLLLDVALPGPDPGIATPLTEMMAELQQRIGLPLPACAVHVTPNAPEPAWTLLAWESPLASGTDSDAGAVVAAVRSVLRRNAGLFIGLQETTAILNRLGLDYPEAVKEAVRSVPTARIADVLRRLAEEDVPLRALRDVVEAIADAGGHERDAARIADRVRVHMKRHILARIAPAGRLAALVAAPDLEDRIRAALRTVDGTDLIALQPADVQAIVAAAQARPAEALIASFDVRRPLRQLLAADLFDLPVIAYNELSPSIALDIVGQLAVPAPALAAPDDAATPEEVPAQ